MRVSRAEAETNHQKVIDVASNLFRTHGFNGIGIGDLMKGAGLTQGGFYKRFESKDDLIKQATKRALERCAGCWNEVIDNSEGDKFASLLDFYLSTGHRQEIADGCAFVALGQDVGRSDKELRSIFEKGIKEHFQLILNANPSLGGNKNSAMVILSSLVGALLLSRSVNDEALSHEILTEARRHLNLVYGDN